MRSLRGTGVALITPFDADLKIDFAALERMVSHCAEGGVNYLVINGTTAENPSLSGEEKTAVLQTVIEYNRGRLPLVYGIGGNNTTAVQAELEAFSSQDISAILSVSPYYNKPTQEGIYQHYKALSASSPLPIILYNVPGRTGGNMSAETCLRLARDFSNIVAVKEASGSLTQVMEIIAGRPEGFLVLSGDDNLTLPILALGGDGVISVSGQAFPSVFSAMVASALEGDFERARGLHYRLLEITDLLFAEGNPAGVKAALELQSLCAPYVRLPLVSASAGLRQKMEVLMERHQL